MSSEIKSDAAMAIRYVIPFPDAPSPQLNKDEVMVAAKAFADKYTGMVVTKETFADCKVAAAEQNAVISKLKAVKTEVNKKAKALVAPVIAAVDEILAVIEPPYKALHDGLEELKDAADKEKVAELTAHADKVCADRFPELTAAKTHLLNFISTNCALKKDGWLTKKWTVAACCDAIGAEADRMVKAMEFINSHVKGKPTDVVRVAKTALVNNGFNEITALEASDKYEKTIEEQKRMELVKRGKDPDAKPAPKKPAKVAVSEPIAADNRVCEAIIKFIAPMDEMKKLVALIKQSEIHYEVIEQKIATTETK